MSLLINELETQGYLTLNKMLKYLKEVHPAATISYPTALKYVKEGKLVATKRGSQIRVTRAEIARWVAQGNFEGMSS